MGNLTSHVREFAEGIGIHLGAQPEKSSDHRRTRRHIPSPPISPRAFRFSASRQYYFWSLEVGLLTVVECKKTTGNLVLLTFKVFAIESD